MRRKRDDTAAARERWKKAARARRSRLDPNIKRDYLRERRFRFQDQLPEQDDGLHIQSDGQQRSPLLYWLDTNGNLHREDLRSAEALIEQWKEHHK